MKEMSGLLGLRIIRRQKNLNQLKVALDLNISREALSHYENGKRSPDLQMLRRLSEYFNVSIDFLINGREFEKK
ncbi:MAG: helix-turn-helix transcriptional regulator [Clostridia bacterium]|nr:helix-turn-helix transcriptional regulator [Clostridia bacterium]